MKDIICVRGGGDLATGVVQKLWRAGFWVYITEIAQPTAIRRTVSLGSAMTEGRFTVEDVTAVRVASTSDFEDAWRKGLVPVIDDPRGNSVLDIRPDGIVDAIIAKHNTGTSKDMAPVSVALGPGFRAPRDVDAVIETVRGHDLGRLIMDGEALPDTATPGVIAGHASERVLRAPKAGFVEVLCDIGTAVQKGQTICSVDGVIVQAPFDGLIRGMITPGTCVPVGLKIGDIDARLNVDWHSISDKARTLGGAVLEAVFYIKRLKNLKLKL